MILAYAVVVGHFTPIHLGIAAVYLFFILSGFWIYQMWGKEYAPTAQPYFNFIVSRLWRLAPIYHLSLALWLVVYFGFGLSSTGAIVFPTSLGLHALHFYFSQLFVLGLATLPLTNKLLPAAWSIDVELQFYLVAPLMIAAVSSLRTGFARVAIYAIALAGLGFFLAFYNGPGRELPQNAFLPMYLVFFLIGVESARTGWFPRERAVYAGTAGAVLLSMGSLALPAFRELVYSRKEHGTLADYNSVFCIAIALLLVPYAIATVRKVRAPRAWSIGLDRDLGNISYEVYLLHGVGELVIAHYFGHLSRHARLPIVTLAGAALLPLSWFVYLAIDRPIDRLRVAWVRSRRPAATVAVIERTPEQRATVRAKA